MVLAATVDTARAGNASLEERLADGLDNAGGDALRVVFESRGGLPVYGFIVKSGDRGLSVGCDATTGRIAEIEEAAASKAATGRYKGEAEEVKCLLQSTGAAV